MHVHVCVWPEAMLHRHSFFLSLSGTRTVKSSLVKDITVRTAFFSAHVDDVLPLGQQLPWYVP